MNGLLDSVFPNIFTQTLFQSSGYVWFRELLSGLFGFPVLRLVSFIFTVIFLVGIIYLTLSLLEQEKEAKEKFKNHAIIHNPTKKKNDRFTKIKELFSSPNDSDWRLAIIEADAMLDELLTEMKVPGGHIGEKLRSLDRRFFPVLNEAWEAHKVRNRIAHEGIAFKLDAKMAGSVYRNYERVFQYMNKV